MDFDTHTPDHSTAELDQLLAELRRVPAAHAVAGPWGDRAQLRARGAFFTPAPLVQFVARHVLAPLLAAAPAELIVLDPACGDGRFLRAAVELVAERGEGARTRLQLVGIERDPATAARARAQLGGLGVACTILEGEALLDDLAVPPVDAVIGNPPYLRSIHLRASDPALWQALRRRFAATSHGEWDLYAAFLERSLRWVRAEGRIGLVVPSRWLTAAFAARLRAQVAPAVEALVDFGAEQVFDGATTYASVALLAPARTSAPAVMARLTAQAGWRLGTTVLTDLGGAPWILRAGDGAGTLARDGLTLGEVAQIAKGCGTNADRVFLVRGRAEGELVRGHNGHGHEVCLEAAALKRCWRGRDVEADGDGGDAPDAPAPPTACVFPYRRASPSGPLRLMPWAELAAQLPRTAAYLTIHREALELRERGRFAGAAFYQFGRPQNLAFLLDPRPKLVIPDIAADGRAIIDEGALVLDSAYAVRPRPGAPAPWRSLPLLQVLLRSPMVRLWLEMAGVPLRGHYLRMKTAFLAPMPLPPLGEALRRAQAAAETGEPARAEELLRQAYDLPRATWARARSARRAALVSSTPAATTR